MAITKTGTELIKQAARWQDFWINLSESNRNILRSSGLVKPEEHYLSGISKGNQNIMDRYGITKIDVNGPKDGDVVLVKNNLLNAIKKSKNIIQNSTNGNEIMTHKARVKVLGRYLSNLKKEGLTTSRLTGIPKGKNAYYDPKTNTIRTGSMDFKNPASNTAVDVHELLEAIAHNKNMLRTVLNPEGSLTKAKNHYIKEQNLQQLYNSVESGVADSVKDIIARIADNRFESGVYQKERIAQHLPDFTGRLHISSKFSNPQVYQTHQSGSVLTGERKLVDRTPVDFSEAMNERILSGEIKFLNEAGGYAPKPGGERFNAKNVKKLKWYGSEPVEVDVDGKKQFIHKSWK
ncbi:MAG: hypothetical protein IKO41_21500 [Lachnospiraceae bacterium]|nr:hypothetical protein [Lachnospiraceae bacterium]